MDKDVYIHRGAQKVEHVHALLSVMFLSHGVHLTIRGQEMATRIGSGDEPQPLTTLVHSWH